jgi:hypothetical protein
MAGQVQPGRLQSPCLVAYVAFSLQQEEIIGGQTPSGYPERNSRLVLAMFPGSGALLSCNHHSNAGSFWLLNIAQEG